MKLLFIIQRSQLRGAENFACQLATELISKGHKVDVVFLFHGIKGLAESYPHLELISMRATERSRFWDLRAYKRLNDLVRSKSYDLVFAHAGDTLKYAVLSKVIFRWQTPIVFRNASMVSQYIRDPLTKIFNRWLYRYTDAIVSVATATKKDLETLFPELKGKIKVIPIGIKIHDEPVVEKNPNQIIHIGGFTFEKNHKALLRIFIDIRRTNPDVRLVLVGDGPLRPSIEHAVRKANLTKHVVFTGSVSNPLHFLTQSSVLLLPSIIEGLGAVILEAFYCKVPVVAYNVGGTKDAIIDNVTGILVSPGAEHDFAKSVCDILREPELYAQMVENAFQVVINNYSIDSLADEFVVLSKQVLSSR